MGILEYLLSPQRTQQAQMLGQNIKSAMEKIQNYDQRQTSLWNAAFGDPKNPTNVTDPKAFDALIADAANMGNPVFAFAPAGMFVGPSSKLWDSDAAFKATQMLKKGVSPEDVWRETGTFKAPDGFLRQEIDDSASKFIDAAGMVEKSKAMDEQLGLLKQSVSPNKTGQKDLFPNQLTEAKRPIKKKIAEMTEELSAYNRPSQDVSYGNFAPYAYEHPSLYEAYPELKKVVVRQGAISGEDGVHGSYNRGLLDISKKGLRQGDPLSTSTHEMQHAVQDIEGFSPGGNQLYAYDLAKEAWNKIGSLNDKMSMYAKHMHDSSIPQEMRDVYRKEYQNAMASREKLIPFTLGSEDPYKAYKNLLGETEARATQARFPLNAQQRRERFPLLDYDTKISDLIIPENETMFRTSGLLGGIK